MAKRKDSKSRYYRVWLRNDIHLDPNMKAKKFVKKFLKYANEEDFNEDVLEALLDLWSDEKVKIFAQNEYGYD